MTDPLLTECPNCGRPVIRRAIRSQDGPTLLSTSCDDCGVIGPVVSAPRMPPGTADPVGLPTGFLDADNEWEDGVAA